MGADAGLGLTDRRHQFAHASLAAVQELQDPEAGGVAEYAEKANPRADVDG